MSEEKNVNPKELFKRAFEILDDMSAEYCEYGIISESHVLLPDEEKELRDILTQLRAIFHIQSED